MSRFLMVDVGAGTVDILYYDTEKDFHYKAVARSPVRTLADDILQRPGDLLLTGGEMGGGPVTHALKMRAAEAGVTMSAAAAATLNHDLQVVRDWGIQIVEDAEAEALARRSTHTHIVLGDIQPRRLQKIVEGFGVPFAFDAVAVCAQDHGVPPRGVSHLDFRHNLFRERLDKEPYPHTLMFRADEVPAVLNRLKSIADSAAKLPTAAVYVMDSGLAAILGASLDAAVKDRERAFVMDAATSHTVGAAMEGGALAGFFEYHTVDMTVAKLEELFDALASGALSHQQVLAEGGHGAFIRKAIGFEKTDVIVSTGPKRGRLVDARLPLVFGAPLGDNMMTGTLGLLEALRRREHLEPMAYH
jgi:uncharacterized protein (DUF1786 family)